MSDDAVRPSASHTDDHDTLAVAWALHALDPAEERAFAAHLATCPACRRTVDEALEAVGDLDGAHDPGDPPPQVPDRPVDGAVDDVPRGEVPPTLRASSPRRPDDEREAPAPAPRGAEEAAVVPLPHRRAIRWPAVVAAVVVLAALGGLVVATLSWRSERDTAAAQARRDAVVADVLRDAGTPGVVHATLVDPQGAMVGMVVDDGTGPRVLTTGLGPNASEDTYVLWGLVDGASRPLGTFDVTEQAPSVRSVPSAAGATPFAGFAVSLEPGRTAPASPTRVVASGQVGR